MIYMPMKNLTRTLVLLLLVTVPVAADIHFIDLNKISGAEKLQSEFTYLQEHQVYFNHWSPTWNYTISKTDLIGHLSEIYKKIHAVEPQNTESYLLQGDIAHYMYNLDNKDSFQDAVDNYEKAIQTATTDYRGYWFQGNHYSMANEPAQAMQSLVLAENRLPAKPPVEFWNCYAIASNLANMPSHCVYALDKVTELQGSTGDLETTIGESVLKRFVEMNIHDSYDVKALWEVKNGDKVDFESRPLGIKMGIDSKWKLSVYKYENRNTAFVVIPPKLKNKKGQNIGYTIAVMFRVADDGETLDANLGKLLDKKDAQVTALNFPSKYDKIKAYEIVDKTMYTDMGGGHMYLVGIEREVPRYPGLMLESPDRIEPVKSGEVQYFKPGPVNNRFKSRIFYTFILDSCGDIHEQSLAVFQKMFNEDVVIE
jgi:tetratricopeptide (TPR) repeat protein